MGILSQGLRCRVYRGGQADKIIIQSGVGFECRAAFSGQMFMLSINFGVQGQGHSALLNVSTRRDGLWQSFRHSRQRGYWACVYAVPAPVHRYHFHVHNQRLLHGW